PALPYYSGVSAPALRTPPDAPAPSAPVRSRRGRALPHVTMALPAARRRWSTMVSLALHAGVIALLLWDFVPEGREHIARIALGAGGEGPAGGGGGGRRGTGGSPAATPEKLEYVRVAPPPPPPVAQVAPPVTTQVVPPVVPPVTPPPVVQPTAPAVQAPVPVTGGIVSAVPGTGGGTGSDGSGGSGPGSGGGVGSGVGTGRGSGTGPGTGGGTQANFPPTPTEMFLPPMPIPAGARGFHLIAEFDVDETGRVVGFTFTETRDGGYNRKIRDVLKSIRFRPGTKPDGTPIRMKAQIEYTLF
ncbi:MAG TPA: hypothetical protein VGD77_17625, partial [Gemmatimonadaceae bacterium]